MKFEPIEEIALHEMGAEILKNLSQDFGYEFGDTVTKDGQEATCPYCEEQITVENMSALVPPGNIICSSEMCSILAVHELEEHWLDKGLDLPFASYDENGDRTVIE